jgi:hypothetical protein
MGINFKETRANLEQANKVAQDLEVLLKQQDYEFGALTN